MNTHRDIQIQVLRHKGSNLIIGESPDLPGLMVPARSEEELDEKLPAAIAELFEARGVKVKSVKLVENRAATPGFAAAIRRVHADLEEAA